MDPLTLVAVVVIVAAVGLSAVKRFGFTQMMILACLVVFLLEVFDPSGGIILDLSFRPIYLENGQGLYTTFTSMFVHASIFHVLGNILFLFMVGVALEDRVGKRNVAIVYFVSGLVAVVIEGILLWGSPTLVLGASGAISGVMGAILVLYPRDRIPMFVGPIFLPSVAVWIAVGSWFILEIVYVVLGIDPGVAYGAHFGGFLVGMLLGWYLPAKEKFESVKALNLAALEPLATKPELKEALERAKVETVSSVRDAWLEYFAKHARCPSCGQPYSFRGSKLKCPNDHEVSLK
ncbi:MAG TPA: rhomboid family intramembrane serine protease [Methanomassiliicoccales archaeon]|nr:rhomboid family intramembrane serine protease [Methanomassiliicoccales archaeon]